MNEAELDRQLRLLVAVDPPHAVQRHVLESVGVSPNRIAELLGPAERPMPAEDRGSRPSPAVPHRARAIPRRLAMALASVALAAAALLTLRTAPPAVGDPAALVARGNAERAPSLEVRVAVSRASGVERLRAGQAYSAGDTLVFRLSSSTACEVTLRREGELVFQGPVPAGDTDLPVGYTLEAGQGPARFVLEGAGVRSVFDLPGVQP